MKYPIIVIAIASLISLEVSFADSSSDLFTGVTTGNIKTVKTALESGADANVSNTNGETALMYSAGRIRENLDIINLLLAKGANVNATDKKKWSSLHYVLSSGQECYPGALNDILLRTKLLITRGANARGITAEGYSALSFARWQIKWNRFERNPMKDIKKTADSLIELLKKSGAREGRKYNGIHRCSPDAGM